MSVYGTSHKGHAGRFLGCSAIAAFVAVGLLAGAAQSASAHMINFENYPTGPVGTGASWPLNWTTVSGTAPQVVTSGALAGSQSLLFNSDGSATNRTLADLRPTAKGYEPLGPEVHFSALVRPGDANVSGSYPQFTLRLLTSTGAALNQIEFLHYTGSNYLQWYDGTTAYNIHPAGFTVGDTYKVDMNLHMAAANWDVIVTDLTSNTVVLNETGLGFRSGTTANQSIDQLDIITQKVAANKDNVMLDNINISNVPEPASLGLLGLDGLLLAVRRRKHDDEN